MFAEERNLTINITAMTNAKDYYCLGVAVDIVEDSIVSDTDTILSDIDSNDFSYAGRIRIISQFKDSPINPLERRVTDVPNVLFSFGGEKYLVSSNIRQAQASGEFYDKRLPSRIGMPCGLDVSLSSGGAMLTRKESLPIVPSRSGVLSALTQYALVSLRFFVLQRSLFSPPKIKFITIIVRGQGLKDKRGHSRASGNLKRRLS